MAFKSRRASLRQRLNLSRVALDHGWITIGAWVLVAACGLIAGLRMPVAMFPDIVFPLVVVAADAPGRSVGAIEHEVVVPLEHRLLGVQGRAPNMTVATVPGRAVATMPFEVGASLDEAERRVRDALAGLNLPADVRLTIRNIDLNEIPVATYAIAPRGPAQAQAARELAASLAARLRGVDGVARVVPLGDGAEGTLAAAPTRVRLDGEPALALQVVKRAGANTLELTRTLDEVVQAATPAAGPRVLRVRAEAPFIRDATDATIEALLGAVALSVLVIYPFLRSAPATAISALAIPTSLLATFLVMALAGFDLETITLLALALVIGIVIDDAIVNVENIARHLPHATDPLTAAQSATDEIGLTITAATLTIVAVFVPVGFMGGVVGTFFRPFGLTVSAAVLASLLVARTLTPVLAARWLAAHGLRPPSALWRGFSARYRRLLELSLRHPVVVLLIAFGSLAASLLIIPLIPQGFIPTFDRGEFEVRFTLPAGSGLAKADAAAARLAARIMADRDVAAVFSVAGTATGNPDSGELHVALKSPRSSTTRAVQARLRAALAAEAPLEISVENEPIIAVAAPQPLEITLTADDPAALVAPARQVLQRASAWPGVADATIAGIGADGDGTWLRRDGRPVAIIRANLSGEQALGRIGDRIRTEIPPTLPPGVQLKLAGESAQAAEVFGNFATALELAGAGVVLVLLLLFRSWQDPLAIAIALPMSAVGALLGLFVARSDFGIVSLLGLVFLTGLASKNAIILVDRINQLRAGGLGRDAAILEAGAVRLRPIVMTSAAAILGMLPIALGLGAGAELRAPMAIAIIGGLFTSTLLSLIVVPVVYQLLDRGWPRFSSPSR